MWAWCCDAEREIPLACDDLNNSYPILEPVRRYIAPDNNTPPARHHAELLGVVFRRIRNAVTTAARAENPNPAVLRVADLHPWIAEQSEPLYNVGDNQQAVKAATENFQDRQQGHSGAPLNGPSQQFLDRAAQNPGATQAEPCKALETLAAFNCLARQTA